MINLLKKLLKYFYYPRQEMFHQVMSQDLPIASNFRDNPAFGHAWIKDMKCSEINELIKRKLKESKTAEKGYLDSIWDFDFGTDAHERIRWQRDAGCACKY